MAGALRRLCRAGLACRRRLLGPQSADVADVVQETMLAAARSARTFDPQRGSLGLWMAGIARNHAVLHLRKQDRRQRLMKAAACNGQLLQWLEGKEPSPPTALAAAELAALVRAALGKVPADYALLLTARYLDGETVTQIALRERASEVAVRSRLARAASVPPGLRPVRPRFHGLPGRGPT